MAFTSLLFGLFLSFCYYILPIILAGFLVYRVTGFQITSRGATVLLITGLVVIFYVDVLMPITINFSLQDFLRNISEKYNLSELGTTPGLLILAVISCMIHTAFISAVVMPAGLILKLLSR
jgi:hypothetical protein